MSIYLERGPRTDDELYELVKVLWGHTIPRHKVCPEHDAPFDAFKTAYFNLDTQLLIHGSRGLSGKSRTMSILGLTIAAIKGSDVNILGGSLNQSQNIHDTMRDAWEAKHAPKYLLKDESKTMVRLYNGAKIQPLTASQKTVRGPHPPTLLLDEIDEMDQAILDAAKGQPMPQTNKITGEAIPPFTAMSSTWQYPDKTFAFEYNRMKEEGFPIFTWCVASGTLVTTARGEVPVEEVLTTDRVLTRKGFRQVQHVTFMGYKPTVDLQVLGRTLRLTPDHKVATPFGWREAGALAADTVPTVGANPRVFGCELVPLATVRGLGLVPVGTGAVDAVRDDLQVHDIHAGTIAAQVIEGHPNRDWTDHVLVDPTVSLDDCVALGMPLGPVAVTTTSRPLDAVGEHGNILSPVWDIGVEDEHEFVAEGIVVHNCYKDTANPIDGWLDPAFIEQKRREMPAEMWRVEYDLGEPSIGTRAFDSEAVERMFGLPFEPTEGEQSKSGKDFEEYHFGDHRQDREYVIAADWAKAQDFTVIGVWDVTQLPIRLVHYVRMRRRPYPVMIDHYNKLMKRYHAEGIHDATGLGGVVADYLDNRARGFLMTGAQRDNMLSEWVSAVENDKARAPRIPSMYKNHLYCSIDAMYSRGKEFHLPDEVCSAALAWKLVSGRAVAVEPLAIPNANDPNWFANQIATNAQKHPGSEWEIGTVTRKSEDPYEYNLMV